ncbi:MAG TPA: type II secretion system protein [Tepidisphaeraceae bacterium]|nr:type II secretion system protein [Tepidisphaeraceae bacterium]
MTHRAGNHLGRMGISLVRSRRTWATRPCHWKRLRGFTLVEVLATLVLLGIIVPVAMRGVSIGLAAASTARRTAEAASLAQAKLNELVLDGTWQTSGTTGDFPDHPEYRWTCANVSRDYGTYEVALTVTWTQRGHERMLSLSTLVYPDAYAGAGTMSTDTPAEGSDSTGGAQ